MTEANITYAWLNRTHVSTTPVWNDSKNQTSTDDVFYPLVKQPLHMIVVYVASYSVVFLLALAGNCLVVGVVARSPPTRSVINCFIVNLAVADLLVCMLCLPISLVNNILTGWQFGAVMCKLTPFLQGIAVNASVNTFAAISVDRYLAICHGLRLRVTRRAARLVIALIWIMSCALLAPWAVYYEQQQFQTDHQTLQVCSQSAWPSERLERAYFVGVIVVSCYTLPLLLVSVCYALIGCRVWHRDAPGVANTSHVLNQSKMRVIKMILVVVVLFAFMWLPLYAIQTRIYFDATLDPSSVEFHVLTQTLFPLAQWLALSSSAVNPVVYFVFSGKFRAGYVDLVDAVGCRCLAPTSARAAVGPRWRAVSAGGPFGSSYNARYGRRSSSLTADPAGGGSSGDSAYRRSANGDAGRRANVKGIVDERRLANGGGERRRSSELGVF